MILYLINVFVAQSVLRIHAYQVHDYVLALLGNRYARVELELPIQNHFPQINHLPSLYVECSLSKHHFVDQTPQAPIIYHLGVSLTIEHFGRNIHQSTTDTLRLVQPNGGESEVCESDEALFVQQNVFRFQVPVNDFELVV